MSAGTWTDEGFEMVITADRVNVDLFDRYSFVHAAFGAVMGYLGVPAPVALGISIAWEVAENPLKDALPDVFPNASHDTPLNATGDVISTMAGYALGRLVRG